MVLALQQANSPEQLSAFRECEECHQPFIPNVKHPHQKCCSQKCNNRAWNKAHKFVVKPLQCVVCHKVFTPKRKLKGGEANACCSEKCQQAHHYSRNRTRKLKYRKDHYVPKLRLPQKCKCCGSIFQPAQDGVLPIYCSDYCSKLAWKNAHRAQIKNTQELKGITRPGTPLRLSIVNKQGQERIADAVFLERQLGKKFTQKKEQTWRSKGVLEL